MREIKFRGKSLKDGEFEYGSLLTYQRSIDIEGDDRVFAAISYEGLEPIEVDPNTVGQFTGLYDKNGKEIYEGDIVKVDSLWCEKICTMIVSWAEDKGRWIMYYTKSHGYLYPQDLEEIEVIGNIHEKNKMMKKFETKTCGTCIAFGKSSCAHPDTKTDCFACAKYQEAHYTLSSTSPTTEISKPIMKEEQTKPLDYYEFTNVYKVNDDIVVANTIDEAIELWKKSRLVGYDNDNIKKVELMHYDAKIKRQER